MEQYETILQRMHEAYFENAGCIPDPASDVGIRMKVLAGEVFSAYSNLEWLTRQVFPQTATGEQLDLHAEQRGLARKAAVTAKGELSFTRSAALPYDVEIPKGTVCAAPGLDGVRVVTGEAGVLRAGRHSVTVSAEAETAGVAGNTAANTITVLVTPPPGITGVLNEAPFVGGSDKESDEELRARVVESFRTIPNGTNTAFYRDKAMEFEDIYSASPVARARGVGTVDVYAAVKGGAPREELLGSIQETLQSLKEINVDIEVKAPELVTVDVNLYVEPIEGAQMADVRKSCQQAVADYFLTLSIGQPVLLCDIGNVVYGVPGVKNYSFERALSADRDIDNTQLAVAGNINIAQKEAS